MAVQISRTALLSYLKKNPEENKIRLCFISQCAPLILARKPGCLLMLQKKELPIYQTLASQNQIHMEILYQGEEKITILLYQPESLVRLLREKDILEFFKERGYLSANLSHLFEWLGNRIREYYEEGKEYPHELGILLGYPLDDVKGYIEHYGENYLVCGYWKVYADIENKIKMFKKYDKARRKLMLAVLNEKEL